ncbi:MAG TPA: type II secretion system F family protein [Tepidisphaeraceae bacterium]|jgi:type II secretory pathway component PulF
MRIAYTGFDKAGKAISGMTEAVGVAEAREALRWQGLFVTNAAQADAVASDTAANPSAPKKGRLSSGQRLKNLAMFSRQLHVLINSGTPIVQALQAIERQCENETWRDIVAGIRRSVEEGSPLSEAMRRQPQHFDAVCRSLVAAGESSGALPAMLDRLAVLTRKQLHLRSVIIGAMIYPCLLISIGCIVFVVMLMFVLPRFSTLFDSLDSPLPPTTKMLLWLSSMLWSYWWAMLILLTGACFGARAWIKSTAGKQKFHSLMLDLPKVGRLARSLMTARLARMLGTLLESRVTLLDALALTRQSAVNVRYADLLARAEDAVGKGEPMSAVLGSTDLIVPCVQEAVRNGEASGKVGEPLVQMADFLDEENDVVVKSLTSIIEPMILIVLGVIVGFIALSMFLPLFDLVSAAQRG